MLDPSKGFVHLPNEKRVYASPARTSLSIATLKTYPGTNPVSIQSPAGTAYLTNQRLVYIPATSTPALQSFSAPLLNLHDTHVTAPLFGPNVWYAALQPVPNGGISGTHSVIEVKMTFKDGGAYDFQSTFERIRERLQQAVEDAVERDGNIANPAGGNVDLSAVHLEELPAYEPGPNPPPPAAEPQTTTAAAEEENDSAPDLMSFPAEPQNGGNNQAGSASTRNFAPPAEPPPGYEEAQQQSVAAEFERRFSGQT